MNKIFYIISGRCYISKDVSRKVYSVINAFKQIKNIETKTFFGGDIISNIKEDDTSNYGAYEYHKKFYRNVIFLKVFANSYSEFRDMTHDVRLYKKLKADSTKLPILIWERSSRLHVLSLLYAKRNKIPYVLEWKDNLLSLYGFSFFKWFGYLVEKWKLKYSDFIVVESGVLKEYLIKKGVTSDKIYVAYNAVDINEFTPATKEVTGKFKVGYVGSYAFYHDVERLVKAAVILKRSGLESDFEFILVGKGQHYDEVKNMVQDLELLNFKFIDPIPMEEVPKWLNKFDICVLPGSTDIICPIKIFEYMACEKATLLPDFACNREVITDTFDGLLFEPFNEQSLADKILWCKNNPEEINRIAKSARETCKNKYTWDKTWGAVLEDILNKITDKKYY